MTFRSSCYIHTDRKTGRFKQVHINIHTNTIYIYVNAYICIQLYIENIYVTWHTKHTWIHTYICISNLLRPEPTKWSSTKIPWYYKWSSKSICVIFWNIIRWFCQKTKWYGPSVLFMVLDVRIETFVKLMETCSENVYR